MFVARIGAALLLMLLIACGLSLVTIPKMSPDNTDPMFPDGLVHDFGKVRRGTLVKHAFRVVNTADLPLRIISLRSS